MKILKTLIFYVSTNSFGRRDATGAFIPEAMKIAKQYNVPREDCIGVKCRGVPFYDRFSIVGHELYERDGKDYDRIIFLCHGWPDKIQLGVDDTNIELFSRLLKDATSDDARVVFFCCSVSRNKIATKNPWKALVAIDSIVSFANDVSNEAKREVVGHYTAGHTTKNPWVVIHRPMDHLPQWKAFRPRDKSKRAIKAAHAVFKESIEKGDYSAVIE